jgi:hypothetical protein
MRILRWVLALLLIFWGLVNIIPLATTYGYKAGLLRLPPDVMRLAPLAKVLDWWQAAVWAVVVGLYVLAGWRLIRRKPAFWVAVSAFVAELLRWLPMQSLDVYRHVFTPSELLARYVAFAVLALSGAAIWWIERRLIHPKSAS